MIPCRESSRREGGTTGKIPNENMSFHVIRSTAGGARGIVVHPTGVSTIIGGGGHCCTAPLPSCPAFCDGCVTLFWFLTLVFSFGFGYLFFSLFFIFFFSLFNLFYVRLTQFSRVSLVSSLTQPSARQRTARNTIPVISGSRR